MNNFSTLWEEISDIVPENTALINGTDRLSWREYEEQAAKIANALDKFGLKNHSKAGLYLNNSNEYLVAQFAIFKVGGVSINVNYRYQAEELIYLLENSDCEAVFYNAIYSDQVKTISARLPKVKAWICVTDGSLNTFEKGYLYSQLLENQPLQRTRKSDDILYMLYTGGTTGMPKGVMYNQSEFIMAMFKTLKGLGFEVPQTSQELKDCIQKHKKNKSAPTSYVACPLMHGTGMWLGSFLPLNLGGSVVTTSSLGFDPHHLWAEVERTKATSITIVGDAFAKPMLDALIVAKNSGNPYDISSVNTIISSGVMWSQQVKDGLLEFNDMKLMDTMGSTEGGMGSSISTRDQKANTAKFRLNPGTIVVDENDKPVQPGSGKAGMIGTSGLVPLGYYKDEEKSKATFREIAGTRYSFPGDYALVEFDGTITLLGRGSNCINTAGEKVYPEEIEELVKQHPKIFDCLVVGLPDNRFGQKIVALVSTSSQLDINDLDEFLRSKIAGYKVPKHILFVPKVERAPNGKANYKWAKEYAEKSLN
ncbi:MAG: AMP-binding protein [Gammaproteobacteria bacterium]